MESTTWTPTRKGRSARRRTRQPILLRLHLCRGFGGRAVARPEKRSSDCIRSPFCGGRRVGGRGWKMADGGWQKRTLLLLGNVRAVERRVACCGKGKWEGRLVRLISPFGGGAGNVGRGTEDSNARICSWNGGWRTAFYRLAAKGFWSERGDMSPRQKAAVLPDGKSRRRSKTTKHVYSDNFKMQVIMQHELNLDSKSLSLQVLPCTLAIPLQPLAAWGWVHHGGTDGMERGRGIRIACRVLRNGYTRTAGRRRYA
jgi:hypothetical protein